MIRLLLFLCFPLFAVDPPAATPAKPSEAVTQQNTRTNWVSVFSLEKNPGLGTLEWTAEEKTSKITLGTDSGYFAFGLVFQNPLLPKVIQDDLKGKDLIQVMFGRLPSKPSAHIANFGTLLVTSEGVPHKVTMASFKVDQTLKSFFEALLVFQAPETPQNQTEEDRLKTTYFSSDGSVNFAAKGKITTIDTTLEGRKIPLRLQNLEINLQTKLLTPFTPKETALKGRFEVAMYWAIEGNGQGFIRKLLEDSFSDIATIQLLNNPAAKRAITSIRKH